MCDMDGYAVLTGIVSWGIDCGKAGRPGVYSNVDNFYEWIENEYLNPDGCAIKGDQDSDQKLKLKPLISA